MIVVDDGSQDGTGGRGHAELRRQPRRAAAAAGERRQGGGAQPRLRSGPRRDHGLPRRRHACSRRDTHRQARAPLRRPARRRRGGQRQGRQPHQPADPLAVHRVHHQPEPRPPRLRAAQRHDGRARRGRRVAARGRDAGRRLHHRHHGRGHGPDLAAAARGWRMATETERSATPRRRTRSERSSGSASAGLRHAAVPVEAPRRVGRYGWFGGVALPGLWLFQIFYQAISPARRPADPAGPLGTVLQAYSWRRAHARETGSRCPRPWTRCSWSRSCTCSSS